jgi:hypothetical protein
MRRDSWNVAGFGDLRWLTGHVVYSYGRFACETGYR